MENKSEKIALTVFLLSLAAIPAVLFLDIGSLMTGEATAELPSSTSDKTEPLQDSRQPSTSGCRDSDGGRAYLTGGLVASCSGGKCKTQQDSCQGKRLTEWYCRDNKAVFEEYECTLDCDEDACLTKATNYVQETSKPAAAETQSQVTNVGELTSEETVELGKQESIKLRISGKEHTLKSTDLTDMYLTLSIDNSGALILGAGDNKNLDINGDGTYDLNIRTKSISVITKRASVALIPLS